MARRKVAATFWLEPEQIRDLRALSFATGAPQAVMVREALHSYLAGRRSEIPPAEPDPNQTVIPGTGL